MKFEKYVGVSPDEIPLKDKLAMASLWIALEIYSPRTLPLRLIQAVGGSAEECAAQLRSRSLDPSAFEYSRLGRPY